MSTPRIPNLGHETVSLRAKRQTDRPKILDERRRFKRLEVSLKGRFMVESTNEYPCEVINMSSGGMAVKAPFLPRVGERAISYVEQLGGLDGTVTRTFDGGFAVEFKISARKRERIANVLTWHSSTEYNLEDRVHERYTPRIAEQKLILPSGSVHACRVIDVSLSGASVATDLRPDIGSLVVLARHRGRVVRHHDKGFAIEFIEVQDPDSIARTFG